MSTSRKSEERFLDKDEKAFVAQSHHPELKSHSDAQLSDLIGKLRDRRDKARDVGARQRREMRGKAAPSGARAAADNTGTREKQAVLAAALKRANKERERRREAVEA